MYVRLHESNADFRNFNLHANAVIFTWYYITTFKIFDRQGPPANSPPCSLELKINVLFVLKQSIHWRRSVVLPFFWIVVWLKQTYKFSNLWKKNSARLSRERE